MATHGARVASIFADGFGRWIVGVRVSGPVESSGAVIVARKAIRAELMERAPRDAQLARTKVERLPEWDDLDADTNETITYYRESETTK